MVLLTIAVLAAAIALYYHFTVIYNYWRDQHVPGPRPIPIFGNTFKFCLGSTSLGVILKELYDDYKTEKVVGLYRMRTPCLLIRDLDTVKHVLIKDFHVFLDRGVTFSRKGLGTNLFHADGETWRALRHRFSPMFSNQKLKKMMYLLKDRADLFIEYVSEVIAVSPEQDVHALMKKYTMSTIWACAFGFDVDTFREEIHASLKKIDQAIFNRHLIIEFEMMYPGLPKKLKMDLFPGFMQDFFKNLVEKVSTERKGVPSTRNDFMDMLLQIKNNEDIENSKKLDDEEADAFEITTRVIEAQVFAFYVAGYETSVSTMGFMLYQLALNPGIQERLRKEVDEYLQRNGGRIKIDTLKELTYMEQVFNETLRMYPIVEHLRRKAQADYECPGTNVKVSKGQLVLISVWGIHHDKLHYPVPEKFNPENFSPENIASRHPCAYLPFGVGPRHCIATRFALIQTRICIIRLLSRFRLEASKNTIRSFSYDPLRIPLTPAEPIYVNIFPRKDARSNTIN
ncbi:cytochrome P450 6B5-like [Leguminivora glycinivorella]|uniref:cytochrome P450 6B5-like n=1 Tax=Leguminivora glycinivorella TaxID=1035111 RepID=UPI00200E31DA|nr:cytochrome P450 6B5-like [Leguminivora glycinivorella]